MFGDKVSNQHDFLKIINLIVEEEPITGFQNKAIIIIIITSYYYYYYYYYFKIVLRYVNTIT